MRYFVFRDTINYLRGFYGFSGACSYARDCGKQRKVAIFFSRFNFQLAYVL